MGLVVWGGTTGFIVVGVEEVDMAECHACEYEWEYSGGLNRATCPSCGAKVEVDNDD